MKIVYNNDVGVFEVIECSVNKLEIEFGEESKDASICEGCVYKNCGAYEIPCNKCIRNVGLVHDKYESEDVDE